MNEKWYERAERRRKELGLNQTDLMAALDVTTRGAVGHYLKGRREPTLGQLIKLATALNMSVGELLAGESTPSPAEERLITKYRKMSEPRRRMFEELQDALANSDEEKARRYY